MPVTKVLSLNDGVQTEVVPATTSAGAGSAGRLIALNSSGQVDSSMLPSSGGSSGPSMIVPRDMYFHMCGMDGNGSVYLPFNSSKNGPTVTHASGGSNSLVFSGWTSHEAQTDLNIGTTANDFDFVYVMGYE